MTAKFHHRRATREDMPRLTDLMNSSISALLPSFLSPEQVTASFEVMGLDSQLIEDRTYFIILHGESIAGCGGWSRRATLFGGNHATGRDDALLDPEKEAARIRAMYTHPDWTRQGIGRMILDLCERDALKQGFHRLELAATLSGQPLYQAAGYQATEHFIARTSSNIDVPLIRMSKTV